MRRLIAWLLGKPLVWTKDFDGATRLRLVHKTPFNEYIVRGIVKSRIGTIKPDGRVGGYTYMTHWLPANETASHLFD